MSKKESPKMQELGPKRYYQTLEKINKDYDKYKAGKRNPKTGEYYNEIHFTDPRKKKFSNTASIGYLPCINKECTEWFSINKRTQALICSKCGTLNVFSKEQKEELERQ